MAKTIRDEQLKLNVVINGDQAKHELFELENANRKLKTANKELFAEKVKLERAGKKETEQYREVTSAIKKNNKEIRENESRMKQLRSEIGITGLTFAQLSRRARDLRFAINNMTPGSPERRKLELELTKINARMKQVRAGAVQTGFSMQKMADGFNKYFGIVTAVLASLTGLYFSFKQLISGSAELSDKLADVRKTTGLTEKKVRELAKSLKTIDTRSSRSELLDLSRIAGKLGVQGKENILGFVRAADQINVALSEDLGGDAEGTIRQVGKLVDIFKVKEEFGLENGLLKVGSAINSLGAASTANEAYLVEFSKRFGGIAPNADISIQDTLGLASTLDQLGQTTEVSTTVLGKLKVAIGKDIPHFASIDLLRQQ